MLFNSQEFIFVFLPVTLVGFFALGRQSRAWALGWLILASLVFYAWWNPINVLIIGPSIFVNLLLAQTLVRLPDDDKQRLTRKIVLILGIAFNLAFLGYFKYVNFARGALNDAFGTDFVLTQIALPLGISFITFQKIAFLVDVHAGRVKAFTLREFCLFVLFFPQLVAGPIVHYREMMTQFAKIPARFDSEHVAVGLTLFCFGLFKKVVLADNIAPFVTPIYEQAASGERIPFLVAWMAAVGFTMQIYFDFSGYSDMALGLGRFFGIRLPANFNSPLRASSIIDFWLRWHMTLTRFLTAYIYNPLALGLTRRALAKGKSGLGGRNTTVSAFVHLLMFPTVLTMVLSGIWHGAGYLFILWGLAHGLLLAINHAWRLIAPRFWSDRASYERIMTPAGFVLTFASVAAAMVLFRSTTVGAAVNLLQGMVGLNGFSIPPGVRYYLTAMHWQWLLIGYTAPWDAEEFVKLGLLIAATATIAFTCPNTLEILAKYEPALGFKVPPAGAKVRQTALQWRPTLGWGLAVSVTAAIVVLSLGGPSEFLYWQF